MIPKVKFAKSELCLGKLFGPKKKEKIIFKLKGGIGSGHFGHSGRLGLVGGSMPQGADKGGAEYGNPVNKKWSEFERSSIENALNRNVKITIDMMMQKQSGEFMYYSYNRPMSDMWATISVNHRYSKDGRTLYTSEPIDSDTIIRYELIALQDAKVPLIKEYYQKEFGIKPDKFIVLEHPDPGTRDVWGVIIAPSTRYAGKWQASHFDQDGFMSDATYDSMDKAIRQEAMDGYTQPMHPESFDAWGTSDQFLNGSKFTLNKR